MPATLAGRHSASAEASTRAYLDRLVASNYPGQQAVPSASCRRRARPDGLPSAILEAIVEHSKRVSCDSYGYTRDAGAGLAAGCGGPAAAPPGAASQPATAAPPAPAMAAPTQAPAAQATPGLTAPAARTLDHLKVGVGTTVANAGVFIGNDRGYCREVNLELEYVQFPDGAADMAGPLAASQVDIAGADPSSAFLNAIAHGINVKFVADSGHTDASHSPAALMVRKTARCAGDRGSRRRSVCIHPLPDCAEAPRLHRDPPRRPPERSLPPPYRSPAP